MFVGDTRCLGRPSADTRTVDLFPEIFPVRLAWAAAAFQTIGGGPMVSTSMIFALIADVCTPEER